LAYSDTTKGTEPQHGVKEGSGEGINGNLGKGSAFADACNKHSDKGGPRHPPGHVENGPAILEPGRSGFPVELEDTPLQVETDTLHCKIEDVIGPLKYKAQKQQHHSKAEPN
jgi:hypothetical protein